MAGRKLTGWLVAVPMAGLALATVYPLVFTTNVALKTRREYVLDRFSPAGSWHWENIAAAWSSVGMARYFLNSVIVVACAVAVLSLFVLLAALIFETANHIRARIFPALVLFMGGRFVGTALMGLVYFSNKSGHDAAKHKDNAE